MRQQELRDEKGKLHKKEKLSSSSRSLPQAEVEYEDVSGGSHSARCFRYLTQDDDAVSSQGSCSMAVSARPSHSRQTREDNFDLDLENIMMMQAIWQSIQEQGGMESSSSSTSISSLPPQPLFSEECCNPNPNPSFSVEPTPSGSFARTVAALSEPRYMRGPSITMAGHQRSANFLLENWTGDLEQGRWMIMDHGSNLVGAGPSYGSPSIPMGTELATQPLAGVGMSSENFEDEMMLGMAVSVAEAGARMSSQGPAWL